MRILYLVHRIPYPPDKGDKIRSYHWLRALASRHETHVVTLYDDPADRDHEGAIRKIASSVAAFPIRPFAAKMRTLGALLSGRPLSLGHFFVPEAKARVRELIDGRKVDAVVCFSSAMAAYVADDRRLPRVMDMVDVDSAKFAAYGRTAPFPKSMIYAIEGRRLGRYEEEIARTFDSVVLCTEPEADLLRVRAPGTPITAISNGTDLPADAKTAARASRRMIFVGAMDYYANVDAVEYGAKEVLPLVREKFPDATFEIVGRNPTDAVKALARIPGVVVHGAVPEIAKFLREGRIALVPLRIAQGIQNKVLEAMAHGLPVVTTPKIGVSLGEGGDLAVRSGADPRELSDRAIELLSDDAQAVSLSDRALAFVRARFAWEPQYRRFLDLIEEAAARRPRA